MYLNLCLWLGRPIRRRIDAAFLGKKVVGHLFTLVLANRRGRFLHWNHKIAFGFVVGRLGAKEKVSSVRSGFLLDFGTFDLFESRFDIAQAIGWFDRLHSPSRLDIVC